MSNAKNTGNHTGKGMAGNHLHNFSQAEDALKETEEQQKFLLKLSDALRPLTNADAIHKTATLMAMEHFGANRCYYCEVEDDVSIIRKDASTPGLQSVSGRYQLGDMPIFKKVIDAGKPFVVTDVATSRMVDEGLRQLCIQLGVISFIDVPVIKENLPEGIFCVVQSNVREWTPAEVELAEDIADRIWSAVKRANIEEALRQSEKRFRYLVAASSNMVYRMSADWKQMYTLARNPLEDTAAPILNWLDIYIPPTERKSVQAVIKKAIRNKQPFELEHQVYTPDGGIGWLFSRAIPILDHAGEITEWIGAGNDITARKEAEAKLHEFNKQLEYKVNERTLQLKATSELIKATLDSSLEMIQVFSAVRDENNIIVDFVWILNNHAAEKMYGKVTGKRLLQLNPGVVEEGIFKAFVEVVETGAPQQYEKHYVHEQFNGWFYQSVVKLNDGVATSTLDITEMKRAQERVRDLEAESRQEIFKAILATQEEERRRISENLHNGLGQVLYGIKISLSHLTAENAQAAPDAFKVNKRYTDKLLTEAIAESRRISHQLMPAMLEDFGLQAAVEHICRQFSDTINFKCSIIESRKADKYLILAVFRITQELMTNVVKHAKAANAQINIKLLDNIVKIIVRDDGIGINIAQAGQPGIGLASIRDKVKLLNGRLKISSKPHNGTSVNIEIPRQA